MKNINFKSIIIGCLLMTCIFLFMGQSNKDGHFNTVYADEIVFKDREQLTKIDSEGIISNGVFILANDKTEEIITIGDGRIFIGIGKDDLEDYIELGPSFLSIGDLVGGTDAHFNAWGIGFSDLEQDGDGAPDAVIGKTSRGNGFIYIQDEHGKEILSRP